MVEDGPTGVAVADPLLVADPVTVPLLTTVVEPPVGKMWTDVERGMVGRT